MENLEYFGLFFVVFFMTLYLMRGRMVRDDVEIPEKMTVADIKRYAKLTDTLLLGCKGKVFDVTENAEMYGKGQSYNCFIGNDASVALGKMKFDKELMNRDWCELND